MIGRQVVLVSIFASGSDLGLFLNGCYVIAADPGAGDSVETVNQVAQSLASIEGVEITRLNYAPHEDDWDWNMVQSDLELTGRLVSLSGEPRVAVELDGGLVSCAVSNVPGLNVLVVDRDVEGTEDGEAIDIGGGLGCPGGPHVSYDVDAVESIWNDLAEGRSHE